jgi:hypothetical protein
MAGEKTGATGAAPSRAACGAACARPPLRSHRSGIAIGLLALIVHQDPRLRRPGPGATAARARRRPEHAGRDRNRGRGSCCGPWMVWCSSSVISDSYPLCSQMIRAGGRQGPPPRHARRDRVRPGAAPDHVRSTSRPWHRAGSSVSFASSMRARASSTEFIQPARGSAAGECSRFRRCSRTRSSWLLTALRPHPEILHLLGEMQQVERAVPALGGEAAQRPRLVTRPGVEIFPLKLLGPNGHRFAQARP